MAQALTIVQMLPELQSGGVERGTLELGKYLVQHGHRSIVISAGGRLVSQLISDGSEHVAWNVGKKSPLTLRYVPKLRKFLRRQNIDILHLRSRAPAWVGYLAWKSLAESCRPRLVTTFHGFYSVNGYSAIMTKGEKVIAVSKAIEEHIKKTYKVPEDKVVLIHRGVDLEIFDPDKVPDQRLKLLKAEWGISPLQTPLIMLPGRVSSWKGHDIFLKSLAAIKDLDWLAVCVGECDKTSTFVGHIYSMLQELQLEKRVLFVEHCNDMPAAYLLADIVVSASSSQAEAFGRVAVEAQAMGRPVVATAHGGSIETIRDHQTGWLVKPGDYQDLAKALREALGNRVLMRQYGLDGLKWIRENFTVERMCAKTVSLYTDLKNRPEIL